MSTTTTTTTTTTMAPEAKAIAGAFDSSFRFRRAEQKLVPVGQPTSDSLDSPIPIPRRFAPQLVETTRRSRRDGDTGLRQADRTDATPYARHGYSGLRSHVRRRNAKNVHAETVAAASNKTDDEVETEAHDAVLDVFLNSRPRGGGAAHFHLHGDDDTAWESQLSFGPGLGDEPRRTATDMGRGRWHGAQEDAERERPASVERGVESEPECAQPGWTSAHKERRVTECPAQVSVAGNDTPLVAPKPRAPFREKPAAIDVTAEKGLDPELEVMRRAASPPLLGEDLVFPRCESPEMCRLTTDLPFSQRATEEKRRDPTQKCGLWGGYCFNREEETSPVVDANKLTPPGNSGLWPGRSSGPRIGAPSPPPTPRGMWASPRSPRPPSQGPNRFQHIPVQRVEPPTVKPSLSPEEKERHIEAEFTDGFVTQLYNYLSLGYPVTARAFDEELATMSGVTVEELRARDEEVMRRGHVCDTEVEQCPAEKQCPRWRALKEYVKEWARGQEDLDRSRNGVVGLGVGVWGGGGSWRP
ncbi:hypothetical protein VUR80DRAFT_2076 [Thermomyces stellatus]